MSTAVKEKKPFLPQRKTAVVVSSAPGMQALPARSPMVGNLVVGGEPRVHLLPGEVSERKALRVLKRRLGIALVGAIVLVAAGYGVETLNLSSAQSQLQSEQATTAQLLSQQARYVEVTKVQNDISAIRVGQKAATTQEILWAPFISNLEATLPAGSGIISFEGTIDLPSAASGTTAAVPLQGPHIATVNVTVSIPQGDIPAWLTALPKLKGYVDATPTSLTVPPAGSGITNYTLVVALHLNEKAEANRYSKVTGASK